VIQPSIHIGYKEFLPVYAANLVFNGAPVFPFFWGIALARLFFLLACYGYKTKLAGLNLPKLLSGLGIRCCNGAK